MKKSFLLLIAGIIAGTAQGQEIRHTSMVFKAGPVQNVQACAKSNVAPNVKSNSFNMTSTAHRTTLGGDSWYSYVNDIFEGSTSSVVAAVNLLFPLWNDTTSIQGYDNSGTPVYYDEVWTTAGLSFDPLAS